MTTYLVGVDLSHRGLGLVAVPRIPHAWALYARHATFGVDLGKDADEVAHLRRLHDVSRDAMAWISWLGATEVWIEGYPQTGFNLAMLCEMGGALRSRLAAQGVFAHTAALSTARKFLLGKLPRKGSKDAVQAMVRSIAPGLDTEHERDAFVVANYGCYKVGWAPPYFTPEPPKPPRAKRAKVAVVHG